MPNSNYKGHAAKKFTQKKEQTAFGDFGDNLPLKAPTVEPQEYPVDALGPVMSKAVEAIYKQVGVPKAICAQTVLASAALAVGSAFQLKTNDMDTLSLNEFFFTVIQSGDGKSRAMKRAMIGHTQRQKMLNSEYSTWCDAFDDYEARRKARALEPNEEPPEEPITGFYLAREPTYEALVKSLRKQPFIGLFSDEGSQFFTGFSMNKANAPKTAGGLIKMWDGSTVTRQRASDDTPLLMYDRRVSLHLMCQPKVAHDVFFNKTALQQQGFSGRFLVTAPTPLDPRLACQLKRNGSSDPTTSVIIESFAKRIHSVMDAITVKDKFKGLVFNEITLDEGETTETWWNYHDFMMIEGIDKYPNLREFVMRAAEHALRLASIITIIENPNAKTVGLSAMQSAIKLADYYLSEAARLMVPDVDSQDILDIAERLEGWMRQHPEFAEPNGTFKLRTLCRKRVCGLTKAADMKAALEPLYDHGRAQEHRAKGSVLIELVNNGS